MRLLSILLPVALVMPLAHAQNPESPRPEQLLVTGKRVYPVVDTVCAEYGTGRRHGGAVEAAAGRQFERQWGVTGIAQYRGLYGDRVAVSLDGLRPVTGGPNAMDTPLSYASPLLLERLSLERGIASVSSATESFGGHIRVDYDRGQHGNPSSFALDGKAQARYVSNGGLRSTAVQLVGPSRWYA